MPPVTKAGGTAFRKDVAFAETKASDEFELEASGIVMVPDKADLQNDFARESLIRDFAAQFETFEEAGQAGGGIMHAVWPDGWMQLERNEVLDEAKEIGGRTVDTGAWVQRWGITNADLAALIDDGVLEGYSIGAIQVDWNGPFEQDEVDDVDTSEVPDDEVVWELTDGLIREVSTVDIPAVPDAQILEAKAVEKRLAEHVGNPDAFVEEAMERGHTEAEAEQLWEVLNDAMEADGASEPGKQSMLSRAGKAFLSVLSGGSEDETPTRTKESRTLSKANRDRLMAAHDAVEDALASEVEFDMNRFTDDPDTDFDIAAFGDHDDDGGDEEDPDAETEASADHAPGSDTPDDTPDMTDDEGEGKSLAEKNAEQIDELTSAVESLTEAVADDGDGGGETKTAEIEIDGTVYEVTKQEALSWFDEDADDPFDDAPEHVKALADRVESVNERIDRISKQSGTSDQLDAATTENEEESGLDGLGKMLS